IRTRIMAKLAQPRPNISLLEPPIQGLAPTVGQTTGLGAIQGTIPEAMMAPTRKRRIAVVLLIASLVIAGVVAIRYMPQWQVTQAVPKGGRHDPIPVLTTTSREADVPVYFDGVGTAKALNTVTVRSQVAG